MLVAVLTVAPPGKLLLFCLGRRCCQYCFSCVASLKGCVLCHAELPGLPDLASYLYFFSIFFCVVLLLVVGLPYCGLIRQCFSLVFFKSKDEPVRDEGKALRALSSHQKPSDPGNLDWSGSAVVTLLGLASIALFSEIAELLLLSLKYSL